MGADQDDQQDDPKGDGAGLSGPGPRGPARAETGALRSQLGGYGLRITRRDLAADGPIPCETRPAALAIGNFDGPHRGHAAVIAAARARAEDSGAELGVLTFEPHPRSVFRPDDPPFRLASMPLRARRLAALGVDALHLLQFNAALSSLAPEAFADEVLAGVFAARHVAVGADFRFGAERAGDVAALRALGARHGFSVDAVAPVGGAAPFSSSAVRRALRDGAPEEAARILGDWHRLEGVVHKGDQRGRELGFPTANLALDPELMAPAFGVYAVWVEVQAGPHRGVWPGVASLGLRPTFHKTIPNFETFLFDFDGDLYGAPLSVALVAFLRPEIAYEGPEPLIRQMRQDAEDARAALAAARPPWRGEDDGGEDGGGEDGGGGLR